MTDIDNSSWIVLTFYDFDKVAESFSEIEEILSLYRTYSDNLITGYAVIVDPKSVLLFVIPKDGSIKVSTEVIENNVFELKLCYGESEYSVKIPTSDLRSYSSVF